MVVEEWINILERVFDFIEITENYKVVCAIYMLRKDAHIWWDAAKKGHNVAEMEWPEFLVLFNSKYYSRIVIDHKVVEFTTLKQGNLSVQSIPGSLITYADSHWIWLVLNQLKYGDL